MATKINLGTLKKMKADKAPAAAITAYDYPSAVFASESEMDWILVGDSGGMTMLGYTNTMPVTMDEMMHFCKAVSRGNKRSFLVGDMPFGSYQISDELAVKNASRFMAEGGCDAIKLEGGSRMVHRIQAITDAGIPVMGHLGLTPQSLSMQGGYRVQGKTKEEFKDLLMNALAVEEAGAVALLLEAIPEDVAALIHKELTIPVYGIGAGKKLDGQLLIFHDVVGSFVGDIQPRFVRKYANVGAVTRDALKSYVQDVRNGAFPGPEHQYPIDPIAMQEIVHASFGVHSPVY